MQEAGKANFDKAEELCQVTLAMIRDYLNRQLQAESKAAGEDSIFIAFQKPARTVMTPFKLRDLEMRLKRLKGRISKENRGADQAAGHRLASFVILNPHSVEYASRLDGLLNEMSPDDPLRDNVLLEKIMWVEDAKQRRQMLTEFISQFPDTDGGIRARYELALVQIQLWKEPGISEEARQQLQADTRAVLTDFVDHYPESIFAEQARDLLKTLPPTP